MSIKKLYALLFILSVTTTSFAQVVLKGIVTNGKEPIPFVKIKLNERTTYSDTSGYYSFNQVQKGTYQLSLRLVGYDEDIEIVVVDSVDLIKNIKLIEAANLLEKVVVSGGLKEISRSKSPVSIEVISSDFLKSNPTPSVFEALQNVNGVRPQNNCNVCSTGDIHINGLEGAYTMILIDGMPIVGGLSSVYGLSGIPQSLIDRVEIVKGPASTLFGSEAVGGIINVITKNPINAPKFSYDAFVTSWGEVNTDVSYSTLLGKKINALFSANYFKYNNTIDNNGDGFTDLTLQDRISLFSKILISRKSNKLFSIAGRYNYEDRWGGELNWSKQFRGGDSVYGESIYTKRWELFGVYELPTKLDLKLQFSSNYHNQNSYYGNTGFFATQNVNFAQLISHQKMGKNSELLSGLAYRYTYYDDNTFATAEIDSQTNMANITHLPGLFTQYQQYITENNVILLGLRYDYNSIHGNIFTPRLNYKWNSINRKNTIRWSVGNGYRVANIFTEDHAALTGARKVEFKEKLKPETSWNSNINYVRKIIIGKDKIIGVDASGWYTYFNNKIIPDYLSDPNKIIYQNLRGYAISQGISANIDFTLMNGLTANIGASLMDVSQVNNQVKQRQLLTERFSGVWKISYEWAKYSINFDYTGNVYSPMLLPLLGELDTRSPTSPWYSTQNVKVSKTIKNMDFYVGVKNLLNFTPAGNSIARPFDPFDKQIQTNANGDVIATANNPQALSFDPSYVYASNQGRRFYLGMSYSLLK